MMVRMMVRMMVMVMFHVEDGLFCLKNEQIAIICEMFRTLFSLCFILALDELRAKINEKMTDRFFL